MAKIHRGYELVRAIRKGKRLDRRYAIAREMEKAIEGLTEDVGGADQLTQGQLLLQDRILEKLVFMLCISQYAFKQDSIIGKDGRLLSCLGKNYLAFANSLRLDLESFYKMSAERLSKIPNLEEFLKTLKDAKPKTDPGGQGEGGGNSVD